MPEPAAYAPSALAPPPHPAADNPWAMVGKDQPPPAQAPSRPEQLFGSGNNHFNSRPWSAQSFDRTPAQIRPTTSSFPHTDALGPVQPAQAPASQPNLDFDPLAGVRSRLGGSFGRPAASPQAPAQVGDPRAETAANQFLYGGSPAWNNIPPEAVSQPLPQSGLQSWSNRQMNSLNDWMRGGQQEAKDLFNSRTPREFLGRAWDALPNDPKLPNTYRDYTIAAAIGMPRIGPLFDDVGNAINPELYGYVKDIGRGARTRIGDSLEGTGVYQAGKTLANAIGDKRPSLSDIFIVKALAQRAGMGGAKALAAGKTPMVTRPAAAAASAAEPVAASSRGFLPAVGKVLANEPFTGIGAATNLSRGTFNVGRGLYAGARGMPGAAGSFATGAKQIARAPLQSYVPSQVGSALASVGEQTGVPGAGSDVNQWMAESRTNPVRMFGDAAGVVGKTFGLGEPSTPNVQQVLQQHGQNLQHAGQMAVDNLPKFIDRFGTAARDLLNQGNGINGPEVQHRELTNEYNRLAPGIGAADSVMPYGIGGMAWRQGLIDPMAQRARGIDLRTPSGLETAYDDLARRRALEQISGGQGIPPGAVDFANKTLGAPRDLPMPSVDPNGTVTNKVPLPFPTQRDIAAAGELAGKQQHGFNALVGHHMDRTATGYQNSAANTQPSPVAQPPQDLNQAGAPPPSDLDPAVQKQVNDILTAAPADVGDGAGSILQPGQAGEKLAPLMAAAGGPAGLIDEVSKMPAPPAGSTSKLGQYWNSLPSASKVLAIAGLSITAISALRSMFGGNDGDEEGFLSRVLPYLGLGAAAWGLGGGTIGFGRENLPETQKYKDLGNAIGDQFGSGQLFN